MALKVTDISIWSDGGKHFRNKELPATYIMIRNQTKYTITDFNHFGEYHFSVISKIIKLHERSGTITDTDHLISVLKEKLTSYQISLESKRIKLESNYHVSKREPVNRTNFRRWEEY